MTTLSRMKLLCGNCGEFCEVKMVFSSVSIGTCDLDSRPPQLAGFNLQWDVQYCPNCGYSAPRIVQKVWDRSKIIHLLDTKRNLFLSERFERAADIRLAQGKTDYLTYRLFLKGAWAADDTGSGSTSMFLRKRYLSYPCPENEDVRIRLSLADTARRVGDFDLAHVFLKERGELPDGDSPLGRLFVWEENLCIQKDRKRHSCGEIFGKNKDPM